MPIPIACSECKLRVSVPDNMAGQSVKCPKCKTTIPVPDEPPPAAKTKFEASEKKPEEVPPPASPKKSGALKLPAPRDEDDADDRDDDAPKKSTRKKDRDRDEEDRNENEPGGKKPNKGLIISLCAAGGLVILGGCIAGMIWAYDSFTGKLKETVEDLKKDDADKDKKAGVPAGWKLFKPTAGGYTAYFPGDPKPQAIGGGTLYEFAAPDHAYELAIMGVRLTAANPADEAKKIQEFFLNVLMDSGREIERRERIWLGEPATEIIVEEKEKPTKGIIVVRFVSSAGKFFVCSVEGKNGRPPAEIERGFFDNVELAADIGPPPKQPKTPDASPKGGLPAGWSEFKPRDGSFKIRLPGVVLENPASGDIAIYTSAFQNLTASIKVFRGMRRTITIEEAIKENSVGKRQIGEHKNGLLAGKTATEVILERTAGIAKTANPKPHTILRILRTNTSVYAVSIESRAGSPTAEQQATFFNSFEILK